MDSLAAQWALTATTDRLNDANAWIVITCCALLVSLLSFKNNLLKVFHIRVAIVVSFMVLNYFWGFRSGQLNARNAINVHDGKQESVDRNLETVIRTDGETTLMKNETAEAFVKDASSDEGNDNGFREKQNATSRLDTLTGALQGANSKRQMVLDIANEEESGNGKYGMNESKFLIAITTAPPPVQSNNDIFTRRVSIQNNTTTTGAKHHAPSHSIEVKTGTRADKLILCWTKLHRNDTYWWLPKEGYEEGLKACEYQHCKFTADKSKIKQADVVLFDGERLRTDHLDWPSYRSPNQLYGHHLNERPASCHEFLRNYGEKINLTINYRENADISTPQVELMKITRPKPGPYKLRIPFKNKIRMAVWPVSHCVADSKRQDYVQELSKYIEVDIYGACGNLTCPKKDRAACFEDWEKKYKFYLAFENAICDDYITEKYYWTTGYELVPVTLSGERYNSERAPHDAIDAKTFRSPKQLADYLIELANNEEAYTEYFQWKQNYYHRGTNSKTLCKVCKTAHTVTNKPAYSDYYGWWFGACDNGLVDRMRQQGGW